MLLLFDLICLCLCVLEALECPLCWIYLMILSQFDSPIKTICATATYPNSKAGYHMISQLFSQNSQALRRPSNILKVLNLIGTLILFVSPRVCPWTCCLLMSAYNFCLAEGFIRYAKPTTSDTWTTPNTLKRSDVNSWMVILCTWPRSTVHIRLWKHAYIDNMYIYSRII